MKAAAAAARELAKYNFDLVEIEESRVASVELVGRGLGVYLHFYENV